MGGKRKLLKEKEGPINSYFQKIDGSSPKRITRRNSIDNGVNVDQQLSLSPETKSIARNMRNEKANKRVEYGSQERGGGMDSSESENDSGQEAENDSIQEAENDSIQEVENSSQVIICNSQVRNGNGQVIIGNGQVIIRNSQVRNGNGQVIIGNGQVKNGNGQVINGSHNNEVKSGEKKVPNDQQGCKATIKYRSKNDVMLHSDYQINPSNLLDRFLVTERVLNTKINSVNFRLQIASFIIRNNLPISLSDDHFFQDVAEKYNTKTVSPTTLAIDIEKLFEFNKKMIINEFAVSRDFVSLIVDMWTSPNGKSFMGVKVNYCTSDLETKTVLVSLGEFQEAHTGSNISLRIEKIVEEMNLQGRVVSIAIDNAANGISAVKSLCNNSSIFAPINCGVSRCLAHILHLSFVSFVKDQKKEIPMKFIKLDSSDPKEIINKMCSQIRALQAESNKVVDKRVINYFGNAEEIKLESSFKFYHNFAVEFNKPSIQKSYSSIPASELQSLEEQCKQIYSSNRSLPSVYSSFKLPIDVDTRWNSYGLLVGSFIVLEPKIRKVLELNNKMQPINDNQWQDLKLLNSLLYPLKNSTLQFSNSKSKIYHSIPEIIDLISTYEAKLMISKFKVFETNIKKLLSKLYQYYILMEKNDLYFVAIVLNPSKKAGYFELYSFISQKSRYYIERLEKLYEQHHLIIFNSPAVRLPERTETPTEEPFR